MAASPVKPMLANGLDWDQIPNKAAGFDMEPKIDGWRCIVHVVDGEVNLYSRTGKPFTEKVHQDLITQFRQVGMNYVMDGELAIFKDDNWLVSDYSATASVLGSGPDVALYKQSRIYEESGRQLKFAAFDFLQAAGSSLADLPQGERRRLMKVVLEDAWKTDGVSHVFPVPSHQGFDDGIYSDIVAHGGEGVMLKHPNALYVPGKRPANYWFKVKKFDTMDVIITGFKPGEGKYAGMVGSLEFSLWRLDTEGKPVARERVGFCRGFDDALCHSMTVNFDAYKYKVMEIRYFGQVGATTEGLRHPQFIRLRPDKSELDCTF